MSYDLNGMLVVIDKAIDPDRLDQAVALANKTVDLARRVLAQKASLEAPSTPAEQLLAQQSREELALTASLNPNETAAKLQKLLRDGSYDCISKSMPGEPERLILFVGDRTWGSEPYGWGYRVLRHAKLMGLLDAVGAA
jgi:hypothetical protein